MRMINKLGINLKILPSILTIALPMVIQGIVFQIQSLTDKAFLGNMDSLYIAALGAAQMPLFTTLDSLVALCTGVIIIVSQLYGAKNKTAMNQYVKSAIFFNTLLSLFIFLLWFGLPEQVLHLLSVDEKIIHYCVSYIKICSFYFIFFGVDCSLQAMLLGIGNTKPIMISGILKVVLNIFISWVLIYGYFGFPALHIEGAAIGALIANMISFIYICFYCFIIKKEEYKLEKDNSLWIKFSSFKESIKLGIPSGMEYFFWNASNLVLIKFLNDFNYLATTIYTLTFGIEIIVYAIFNGNSKAVMTLMGQSIGASNKKSANQQLMTCMFLNLIIVVIAIIIFILFPNQILSIFTQDHNIVVQTVPYLIFTAVIMLPKSLNVVIGNGIRAYGNTKWMLYSQIIGSIFVVVCSFVLVKILNLYIVAIYITFFLDESIRAAINYGYYVSHYKNNSIHETVLSCEIE